MRSDVRVVVALALCCAAAPLPAHAHAPLARGLLLAPDGSGMALRMPGFGLLVRARADQPFAYACDAVLGLTPEDTGAAFAYRGDGALLVGAAHGLRIVRPDGCPAAAATGITDPVVALAVHPRDRDRVYAVTGGSEPAVLRSGDGGATFELRSAIAADVSVSALLLDPGDPDVLYTSQRGADGPAVARSSDGGVSFAVAPQGRELVLLDVESRDGSRLWARAATVGAVRGADILRADSIMGPWQQVLSVNFFGGFAIDRDSGAIWVGDEGGSVFRSLDGGASFEDVMPKMAVACLAHARGTLWACTPGSSAQRALASWVDGAADFESVMAFADVDRLIACGPETDVAQICDAAWDEWRVDVLGVNRAMGGAGGAGSAGGAGGPARAAAASCAAGATPARCARGAWFALAALALGRRTRRRSP